MPMTLAQKDEGKCVQITPLNAKDTQI